MAETEDFLAPRTCLLPPLPEHEAAAEMLSEAADAILAGDLDVARGLVRRTDIPVLFEHVALVMSGSDPRIQHRRTVEVTGLKSAASPIQPPSSEYPGSRWYSPVRYTIVLGPPYTKIYVY